jgi:hypothetical protein
MIMPFCPECRAEYRAETRRCPDCDLDLVDSLPEEQPDTPDSEGLDLVELASFPNYPEAEMIKEVLESNGIRTVLRGEADPIGVVSGATPSTLLVEERDSARAREIYDAYFAGEGAEDQSESTDSAE